MERSAQPFAEPLEDEDEEANGVLLAASVAGRTALGTRAAAKVRRLQRATTQPFRLPPLCGEAYGYNLHAAVVIGRGNRDGLQRLCCYVLRPPLARTRLQRRGDGLLVLTLCKPYANGTTDFLFSEVEPCATPRRPGPALPEERRVLPRRARLPAQVPQPGHSRASRQDRRADTADEGGPGQVPMARLGRAVVAGVRVDGLACACGGRLVLHAIVQPPATLNVLDSLRRSAKRRARAPPMAS